MPNTFNAHLSESATRGGWARVGDRVSRLYSKSFEVENAKAVLQTHSQELQNVKAIVDANLEAGRTISKELQAEYRQAARAYNMSLKGVSFATYGTATFEGMFKSMADAVGINTSKWGSTRVRGDIVAQTEKAMNSERSLISRIVTKPFRLVHSFPGLAAAGVAVLGVIGVGSAMHRRAEARTEQDAIQQAQAVEAQQAQMQQLQQIQQMQLQQQQQQPQVQVTVQPQTPLASTQMNPASPKIMAGNDNVQYEGKVATPQLAASV